MAYDRHTWVNNELIDAEDMNRIEQGIAAADAAVSDIKALFDAAHPVGCYYWSSTAGSPSALGLSDGTWEQVKDVFLLSAGDEHAVGDTGGAEEHTLTVNEMPSHAHGVYQHSEGGTTATWGYLWQSNDATLADGSDYNRGLTATGGGQAFSVMPPYLAAYCWHRTA